MSGANGNGAEPRQLDLDARRAARAEARGESPGGIKVGGDFYPYASELPVIVLEEISTIATPLSKDATDEEKAARGFESSAVLGRMLVALVGADAYAELTTKHSISLEDAEAIVEDAMEVYGTPFGKPPESATSSRGTSARSRPASSRSTARTSGPRSGAKATR